MPKYKHLEYRSGSLDELRNAAPRQLTPRQIAQRERDDEIRSVINQAAALPASEWAGFELKEGQKLPTLRAAVLKILRDEPRDINFGVRGNRIVFSKGAIPGGRGRARGG